MGDAVVKGLTLADFYVPRTPPRPAATAPTPNAHRAGSTERTRREMARRHAEAERMRANYAEPPPPPEVVADLRTLLALVGQALAEHDRRHR